MTYSLRTAIPRAGMRRGFGDLASKQRSVIDLFRALYLQADQEQRVVLVNNYWHILWRAAGKAGLPRSTPVMQKLDATMGQWWAWKQQYDEAVLRRWIPTLRAWGDELDKWSERFDASYTEITNAEPKVAAILDLQAFDPKAISPDDTSKIIRALKQRTGDLLASPWFWPVVGTIGALVVGTMALRFYQNVKHEVV